MPFGTTPAGYGLQALANVLAGTGQGAQQADVLNQRWAGVGQGQQHLDLLRRQQELQNAQHMADVPTLFKSLGLPVPEGAGQTPVPVADLMLKTAEARRMQGIQEQQASQGADVLDKIDPQLAALVRARALTMKDVLPHAFPVDKYAVGAPGTTPFSTVTGLPPAGVTPGQKFTQHVQNTPDGPVIIVTDQEGNLIKTVPTGLKAPEGRGVYTRSDIEDQLVKERLVPDTLAWRQRYNDLARQIPLGPGGEIRGAGTGLGGTAPAPTQAPSPAPGPGLRSGALAERPPIPTAQEAQTAADTQTWITQAREAADHLDKYLASHPGVGERLSYAIRSKAQGTPLVGSNAVTTPEEQKLASEIGNLQITWERASGGLRMASSPGMQERIRMMFGDPANAATPTHLRTIAGQMEGEITQRAATERQSGRQPIALPPGGLANPNQNSPQTKGGLSAPTGNRIRVRSKADPSRMGWLNAGEPIPADVEVVR